MKTLKEFKKFLAKEKIAKIAVKDFGEDEGDLVDVLTMVYPSKFNRNSLFKFLNRSHTKEYVAKLSKPIKEAGKFMKEVGIILTYDNEEGILQNLIKRKLIDYRRRKLGPNATKKAQKNFQAELKRAIKQLD